MHLLMEYLHERRAHGKYNFNTKTQKKVESTLLYFINNKHLALAEHQSIFNICQCFEILHSKQAKLIDCFKACIFPAS